MRGRKSATCCSRMASSSFPNWPVAAALMRDLARSSAACKQFQNIFISVVWPKKILSVKSKHIGQNTTRVWIPVTAAEPLLWMIQLTRQNYNKISPDGRRIPPGAGWPPAAGHWPRGRVSAAGWPDTAWAVVARSCTDRYLLNQRWCGDVKT